MRNDAARHSGIEGVRQAGVFAIPLLVLVVSVALAWNHADSFPRMSVETGLPCKTCHINPNGAGARTEFGNYAVALNELCLPQTKKEALKRYRSPRLSESVVVGFDSRYLVFDDGYIFRMQTDAFLTVEPLKEFYYSLRFWENGISENYALLYFDDQKYYAKFGRFSPAYGLRIADHKSYVRERTGYGSNVYLDGLSLGAEIKGVNIVAEFFNPVKQKVIVGHAFRPGFLGPIGYLAGLSVRRSEEVEGLSSAFPNSYSFFGGISYDRLTGQAEIDLVGKSSDTLIAYASLTARLEYGLYLIGEYNFFDGNRSLSSGVDEFIRFSIELYPISFIELRPSYTRYTRGPLKNEDDFFVQLHFGY